MNRKEHLVRENEINMLGCILMFVDGEEIAVSVGCKSLIIRESKSHADKEFKTRIILERARSSGGTFRIESRTFTESFPQGRVEGAESASEKSKVRFQLVP